MEIEFDVWFWDGFFRFSGWRIVESGRSIGRGFRVECESEVCGVEDLGFFRDSGVVFFYSLRCVFMSK